MRLNSSITARIIPSATNLSSVWHMANFSLMHGIKSGRKLQYNTYQQYYRVIQQPLFVGICLFYNICFFVWRYVPNGFIIAFISELYLYYLSEMCYCSIYFVLWGQITKWEKGGHFLWLILIVYTWCILRFP